MPADCKDDKYLTNHNQSNNNITNCNKTNAESSIIYNTAIYLRISKEDKVTSDNSLKNQKDLLLDYISHHSEFNLRGIFEDNGRTGTDFIRPAFRELMNKVKTKEINCIMVKDLSRFGRNYIEAGEYIEMIFPMLGLRFISVNDHYDSKDYSRGTDSLSVPMKNIMNETYSKDLSRKIRTTFQFKKSRGEFIQSIAPFGYIRHESDNALIIDEKAAKIVRKIYIDRASGKSYTEIAKDLNDKKIPSPNCYKYQLGLLKNKKYKDKQWGAKAIKDITNNPIYLGNSVYNKTKRDYNNKIRLLPKEEWMIVKNTHKAIISKKLFNKMNY